MSKEQILLVYDRQCPFCENYSQRVRLRENVGEITLVDARQPSAILDEITKQGFDLDNGMVVKMAEHYYYGSDAIHILALLSSRSGMFNKFNYWCFRSKSLSRMLYPVLRSGRNLVLKLIGRSNIRNLE